ncbi:MAG: gamma-glutamyl-gamma-aminobutyrate hydrolase family protein [Flavobacteriales bacterium]|nr:gamma-glutamyl-gamma-aminobutyrate hydrolase family protein [Bacteroidota bacterium]MCB9239864.1 gamma-glutamyl-gamma-aminobutyrate hydrolase family protein [Flavobacteriales bacterium]
MRIGITQRVETVAGYGEVRDCLDQNWFRFLEAVGVTPIPIPNSLANPVKWYQDVSLEALVLSGGNDLSELIGAKNVSRERDRTEKSLLEHCRKMKHPVIGVCRGMQLMGSMDNQKLVQVEHHAGTRHRVTMRTMELPILPEVNSYHNWAFDKLSDQSEYEVVATTDEGHIECIMHHNLPWIGMMWHPERENSFNESDIELFQKLLFTKTK